VTKKKLKLCAYSVDVAKGKQTMTKIIVREGSRFAIDFYSVRIGEEARFFTLMGDKR